MAQKYFRKNLVLPNGKRKDIYAKTEKELRQKVLAAQLELGAGVDISNKTTLRELYELWIEVYKKPYIAPSSLYDIQKSFDNHVLPYIGERCVRDIKGPELVALINRHGYGNKSSSSTLVVYLRNIFNLAVDLNLMLKSPVPLNFPINGKATEKEIPLTEEQTAKLLKGMDKKSMAYRFTLLCLSTGLRRGEALALRWDMVDLKRDIIKVERNLQRQIGGGFCVVSDLKTVNSRREVPIPLQLHACLASETNKHGYVVHSESGPEVFYNAAMNGYVKKVWLKYLPERPDIHAHMLRHTYATRLFESKNFDIEEISSLLGHADASITLKVYTHYDKSRKEKTFDAVRNAFVDYAQRCGNPWDNSLDDSQIPQYSQA